MQHEEVQLEFKSLNLLQQVNNFFYLLCCVMEEEGETGKRANSPFLSRSFSSFTSLCDAKLLTLTDKHQCQLKDRFQTGSTKYKRKCWAAVQRLLDGRAQTQTKQQLLDAERTTEQS